jgi:hypothetical protein
MKLLLLVCLAACNSDLRAAPTKPAPSQVDARFALAIRAAAKQYQKWGRVDERPNVAPLLCDMPRREHYGSKGQVRMSEAEESPHGKKLYYLWASDRAAYLKTEVATGFAIVKESFAAMPATTKRAANPPGFEEPLHDTIDHEGKRLTTGAAKGLYVMTKVGGDGTDDGWIYGTITTDGVVTSAGRVATCMGCHEEAPHGRLFGLQ